MNTESCDMVRVADEDAVFDGPPGAFYIEQLDSGQVVMWHKLPNGDAGMLRIRPCDTHPSWDWDRNEDKPTLNPSVHLPGRWHGWFRNGRMESC